jgi:predicted dehydrogenase
VADLVSSGPAPRAALVGAGKVATDHVAALRAAGARVTAVTTSPGSPTAAAFAGAHGIDRAVPSVADLAADGAWDVAVVAVPAEKTIDVVAALAPTGRPLLVEKPGALDPDELDVLRPWEGSLLFGYNRRFYEPVRRAAELLEERGPALVELVLPEPAGEDAASAARRLLTNGTHGLDLLLHLVGPVSVDHVAPAPAGALPRLAVGRSARGDDVVVLVPWDSPANARLTLHWSGHRFELLPFEAGRDHGGMDVVEPTSHVPVRSYRPRVDEEVVVDATIKPGFAAQAEALLALARGEPTGPAARLADAQAALHLAHAVAGG